MTYPSQRSSAPLGARRASAPPYPEDPTTATRHLCAAAYLDEDFRDTALREVYYQNRRVVAPSYGFDLVPVLAHGLRARNAAMVRDVAVMATLLFTVCFARTALVGVLAMMAYLQAVAGAFRLSRDAFRRLRGDAPVSDAALIPRAVLVVLAWVLANLLSGLLIWMIGRDLQGSLLLGGVESAEDVAVTAAVGSLAIALLVFSYPVAFSLWRQAELSRLTPGSQITVPAQTPRLDEVSRQQRGNTVIYSGFRPFVGSGAIVDRWGFAQRLVRPEPSSFGAVAGPAVRRASERQREFAEPPFEAQELVDYVRSHLSTLLAQRAAEECIPGLTIEDKVFLAGTEVAHLVPATSPEVMRAVIRHPTTPARHYLACQVFSWGGELVTTVYVHIAVQGRSLYLELTTTALSPCRDAYRVVDSVEGNGAAAWLRALRTGLLETPRTIWRAPLTLARALINLALASAGAAATGGIARGYDYGARIGVRELGSRDDPRNLVQLQDVEKYPRLIERRVLASVLDFLDEHDIDTSEYRARAAVVLNKINNVHAQVANVDGTAHYHGDVAGGNITKGDTA
jgi:hypothetical protein